MIFGLWLSLVERCVRDAEAVGSNPTSPIDFRLVLVLSLLIVLHYDYDHDSREAAQISSAAKSFA